MSKVKAVVVHSGGMDSSLCLAKAIYEDFEGDRSAVVSLSFRYGQRHADELDRAREIATHFGVENFVVPVACLEVVTDNALINEQMGIEHRPGEPPNTMVLGRNGLMARVAALYAHRLGAKAVYMGVIEVEHGGDGVGYRDCSRAYMDRVQELMRIDLADPAFEIRTPVVHMSKKETMELGQRLGVLHYLLDRTITCYQGVAHGGCRTCPACLLRNEGLRQFMEEHPDFMSPFTP